MLWWQQEANKWSQSIVPETGESSVQASPQVCSYANSSRVYVAQYTLNIASFNSPSLTPTCLSLRFPPIRSLLTSTCVRQICFVFSVRWVLSPGFQSVYIWMPRRARHYDVLENKTWFRKPVLLVDMLNKGQGDLIESFKASNCHSFLFPTLQSKLTIWETPFYIPMGSALFSLRPHGFNIFFASDALLNIKELPLFFLQRFALWNVPSNSVSDLCVPSSLSMMGSYLTLDRTSGLRPLLLTGESPALRRVPSMKVMLFKLHWLHWNSATLQS